MAARQVPPDGAGLKQAGIRQLSRTPCPAHAAAHPEVPDEDVGVARAAHARDALLVAHRLSARDRDDALAVRQPLDRRHDHVLGVCQVRKGLQLRDDGLFAVAADRVLVGERREVVLKHVCDLVLDQRELELARDALQELAHLAAAG
eukprot:337618-Chlamydomonas_euryale.AAC.2